MKTILIPTDFSVKAFDCIPSLCKQLGGEELNIVFIHLFKLSDSIHDLLLLSRRSKEYEHVSDAFYKQCGQVRNAHEAVKSIRIEFFYGSTLSRFKNFIEANEIDYILHPEDCCVSPLNKTSVDPTILIDRCNVPLLRGRKKVLEADLVREEAPATEIPVLSEVSL